MTTIAASTHTRAMPIITASKKQNKEWIVCTKYSVKTRKTCNSAIAQRLHGSVLAKSVRGYFADVIGLSSTTVTQSASKAIEFGKITQNKGYCAIQGHSRSPMSVPIENPYATYWLTFYLVAFGSNSRLLLKSWRKNGHCVFESPLGEGLKGNVHCSSKAHCKA